LTIRNARAVQLKNVKIKTSEGEKVVMENAEVEGLNESQ
jgi:hypothetical protein